MSTEEPTIEEALRRMNEGEKYAVNLLENLSSDLPVEKVYIGFDPCDRNARLYLTKKGTVKRILTIGSKPSISEVSLKRFWKKYGSVALREALKQIQRPVEAWQLGDDEVK